MSSPISSWEGASTIFTYADKPAVMGFILAVAVALTVFAIWARCASRETQLQQPDDEITVTGRHLRMSAPRQGCAHA